MFWASLPPLQSCFGHYRELLFKVENFTQKKRTTIFHEIELNINQKFLQLVFLFQLEYNLGIEVTKMCNSYKVSDSYLHTISSNDHFFFW